MDHLGKLAELLFALILLSSPSWGAPLSQWIYEDTKQVHCSPASREELKELNLSCQPGQSAPHSGAVATVKTLDQLSEFMIFEPIAAQESKTLGCMVNQTKSLANNPEIHPIAVEQACAKLPLLRDTVKNRTFLEKKIKEYKSLNDRSVVVVPEQKFQQHKAIIAELENRLRIYQELEKSIRASDSLLTSPSVFSEVEKALSDGWLMNADSAQKVCDSIRKNSSQWLNQDAALASQSKNEIDARLAGKKSLIGDETFLRNLWASNSRDAVWGRGENSSLLKTSAFCRMEARYGEGAEMRDHLLNIASFALGGAASGLGKLAVFAAYSSKAEAAVLAARVAMGIDIGVGAVMGAQQTIRSCSSHVSILTTDGSCADQGGSSVKQLFYKRLEAENCVLTASMNLTLGALSTLGIRNGIFETNKHLQNELAGEFSNTSRSLSEILDGTPRYSMGDEVLIPRSNGGYSRGHVVSSGNGKTLVTFNDLDASGVEQTFTKRVDTDNLADVGTRVSIPRSSGAYTEGVITAKFENGNYTVSWTEPNGSAAMKTIEGSKLRVLSREKTIPQTPEARSANYSFKSRKISDYTARGGSRVVVDFSSPDLQEAVQKTMHDFEVRGVRPLQPWEKPTPDKMRKAAVAWLASVKRFEDGDRQAYSSARDALIHEGGGKADLGKIAACSIAVCRELSMLGSVAFSELGYTTRVVKGNVKGGGHAWIEFLDPHSGEVIGIVDNNYTRKFYSNPAEYYQEVHAQALDYTTVALPKSEPRSWQ